MHRRARGIENIENGRAWDRQLQCTFRAAFLGDIALCSKCSQSAPQVFGQVILRNLPAALALIRSRSNTTKC